MGFKILLFDKEKIETEDVQKDKCHIIFDEMVGFSAISINAIKEWDKKIQCAANKKRNSTLQQLIRSDNVFTSLDKSTEILGINA